MAGAGLHRGVGSFATRAIVAFLLMLLPAGCVPSSNDTGASNPLSSLSAFLHTALAGPGATVPPELAGLFVNAPYDRNAPLNNQYPRVAFTVLASPPNHAEMVNILVTGGGQVPPACWQLEARIWSSPTVSKDTGPFTICMPGILSVASGVPLGGYDYWLREEATIYRPIQGQQTTGERRTLGPIPPDTVFPEGVRYLGYYRNLPGSEFPSIDSEEGYMWASLLYGMGFDWDIRQDRRVWIYKYVAVTG
jgi:hypothetical protein